jgi:hypothetical protein
MIDELRQTPYVLWGPISILFLKFVKNRSESAEIKIKLSCAGMLNNKEIEDGCLLSCSAV